MPISMYCEICRLLGSPDDQYVIQSTGYWRVALATDQLYLGRAYVTLKRHARSISSLTENEWAELHKVMRCYEQAVRETFGADPINWASMQNLAYQRRYDDNSSKILPAEPHVHWHARPRYKNAPHFAGRLYPDEAFGRHYERSPRMIPPPDELAAIATALRQGITRAEINRAVIS